jgi:hypothetical protein
VSPGGDRRLRLGEGLVVGLAVGYVLFFAWLQRSGLGDPHVLEWDARNMLLPAWRYHGTGLFPRDLTVDLMARFATPGWKAIYWLGTLFADPRLLSRLLPFAGLLVVAWQGWAFGRHFGGRALGAATVIALVHCTFLWNRMAGGHARAFAFPLVVAFLRYAAVGAERRALLTLGLQALCYPSVFVFSVPAYALALGRADRGRWLRFLALTGLCGLLLLGQTRPDARFGGAPTLAQAATLAQMQPGGAQPYYPLQGVAQGLATALAVPLHADGDHWLGPLGRLNRRHPVALVLGLLVLLLLAARRRLGSLPRILPAFALASLGAFFFARLVAYRLYLPDRMLVYAWPPLLLVALPLLLHRALEPRLGARAPLAAGGLVVGFLALACGDGLARNENLTFFGAHHTPVIRWAATRPKDALFATHPERATYVQTFALRNVLFSSATNVPWFFGYAQEMERRIGDFFRAYYAGDLAEVRAFARHYQVDYLIADERDFGPAARERARYYAPFDALNARLIAVTQQFALAAPPPAAVVYRDGPRFVLDLHAL